MSFAEIIIVSFAFLGAVKVSDIIYWIYTRIQKKKQIDVLPRLERIENLHKELESKVKSKYFYLLSTIEGRLTNIETFIKNFSDQDIKRMEETSERISKLESRFEAHLRLQNKR